MRTLYEILVECSNKVILIPSGSYLVINEDIENAKKCNMPFLIKAIKNNKGRVNCKSKDPEKIAEFVFQEISKADPVCVDTGGKKTPFISHIIKWFVNGEFALPEDRSQIFSDLNTFIELSRNPNKRFPKTVAKVNKETGQSIQVQKRIPIAEFKITDFETLHSLRDMLIFFEETGGAGNVDVEGFEKIGSNGEYSVYAIDKYVAGGFEINYGKRSEIHKSFIGTRWCVRWRGNFESYLKGDEREGRRPTCYLFTKDVDGVPFQPYALMHIGSRQLKNKDNHPEVEVEKIADLLHLVYPQELFDELVIKDIIKADSMNDFSQLLKAGYSASSITSEILPYEKFKKLVVDVLFNNKSGIDTVERLRSLTNHLGYAWPTIDELIGVIKNITRFSEKAIKSANLIIKLKLSDKSEYWDELINIVSRNKYSADIVSYYIINNTEINDKTSFIKLIMVDHRNAAKYAINRGVRLPDKYEQEIFGGEFSSIKLIKKYKEKFGIDYKSSMDKINEMYEIDPDKADELVLKEEPHIIFGYINKYKMWEWPEAEPKLKTDPEVWERYIEAYK